VLDTEANGVNTSIMQTDIEISSLGRSKRSVTKKVHQAVKGFVNIRFTSSVC